MKFTWLVVALLIFRMQSADAQTTAVLAPVSSVGESKPAQLVAMERLLEKGLRTIPGFQIISAKQAAKQSRKAKRSELRSCGGDATCLSKLGLLMKAKYTIYAELGGLGTTRILYLKLIDVSSAKELRSTTLSLTGAKADALASRAAATRLLAPKTYVGSLEIKSSIAGAKVFLDGHIFATTPFKALPVYVGSHALRVTHPEARDYVRFVDIHFGALTSITANLQPLPSVNKELIRNGVLTATGPQSQTTQVKRNRSPWYLRWYTITGGVAAIAITSAIIFSRDSPEPDLVIEF